MSVDECYLRLIVYMLLYRRRGIGIVVRLVDEAHGKVVACYTRYGICRLRFNGLFFHLSRTKFRYLHGCVMSVGKPCYRESGEGVGTGQGVFLGLPTRGICFYIYATRLRRLGSLILLRSPTIRRASNLVPFVRSVSLGWSTNLSIFEVSGCLGQT